MKKIIREGVFETNSSSTHSVVFKKREGNKTEKESSYELHTPFAKTMFLIGLCANAEKYCYTDYDNDYEFNIKEELGEAWSEDLGLEESVQVPGNKSVCEKFKNAVIAEYIKMAGITQEEFNKQFNESEFTCDGECLCRNFFDDDVLNDCTCHFEGFYSISHELKLNELQTDEDYQKKAEEFLSDEYKFVLCEFWNAFCLINSKTIY